MYRYVSYKLCHVFFRCRTVLLFLAAVCTVCTGRQEYMMQQGGVSKATKTLNLSEDIFAGMDFVLRGGGVWRETA